MKCCVILLLGCLLVLTGCSTRLGDFTVLTTKNVDLSSFSTQDSKGLDRVRGEDVMHVIILFPNKNISPKEAVDAALDSNNAYMLSDAVLRYDYFIVPYIYGQAKYIAEGVPVKRK
jgi:hypothetical protein